MNYSTVQASNLTAMIGVLMIILQYFKVNITESEIQSLIGGVLAVAGILLSWWRRYKEGGISLGGFRKPTFES